MENVSAMLNNPLLLFFSMLVALTVMEELGVSLAARSGVSKDSEHHEQIVRARDTLSLLLSLLLGFTLAMALPRYDLRKELVIEEADSIGTTALRAEMLPATQRNAMQPLLSQYVDARMGFATAKLNDGRLEEFQEQSKRLQNQMWQQATAAAQVSPTPITSMFIQSLNEMIDLSEKRLASVENRIPITVWIMLVLIGLLTGLTDGASARKRLRPAMVMAPLMIAIVMGLIADLDSPRTGFIRTDVRSLERIQRDLKKRLDTSAHPTTEPADDAKAEQ
jgi:hypothetical protein